MRLGQGSVSGGYGTSGRCFRGYGCEVRHLTRNLYIQSGFAAFRHPKRLLYRQGIGGAADGVSALRPERWRPARRMQLCGEYRYRDVRKLPARLHVLLRCKGRCGSGGEEVRHARYSLSHDAGISAAGGYHSRTYRRESAENTGKVVLNAAAAGLIQTVRRRLVAICG